MKKDEILNSDYQNLTIQQIYDKLDFLIDELTYLRAVRESYKKRVKRYQEIIEKIQTEKDKESENNFINPII